MKILCLHGFLQSASIFKAKTGSFRSALPDCEFVYVDAPIRVHEIPAHFLPAASAAAGQ